MTSPRFRRYGVLVAAVCAISYIVGAPVVQAQTASNTTAPAVTSAPAASAPATDTAPVPDPSFDPSAPGTSSAGVTYVTDPSAITTRGRATFCFGHRATIIGTPHDDRIYGTKANDVIVGLGGNDTITAGEGNDLVCGAAGDDQIYGLQGRDKLNGQSGADGVYGGDGDDRVYGEDGNDTMSGDSGTDYLWGAAGNDTIFGGDSTTVTPPAAAGVRGVGGDSLDYIYGGPNNDTLNGGDGNDNMYGQGGNDSLEGGDGNDRMIGGPGRDAFTGDAGDDTMTGGSGDDTFDGGEGNDTVYGDGGLDAVSGGDGNDTVYGGDDSDLLNGGAGGDTLYGDGGGDIICGGAGVDTVNGGDQDDLISGEGDNCGWTGQNTADAFSTDDPTPSNLIDGGEGLDACVSPSFAKSPQTIHCESGGFFKLTVTVVGSGGFVTGIPVDVFGEALINCDSTGGTCVVYYLSGTDVTLTAHDTTGVFFQWSGDIDGCGTFSPTDHQCEFIMDRNRAVTATFVQPASLSVIVSGPATVASTDTFISCTSGGGASCSHTYPTGQQVTLTASGGTINTWVLSSNAVLQSGCTAGNSVCTVTMNGSGTVTANSS